MAADLVVDASGRHSHSSEWLAHLGYAAPAEETIGVRISYATRFLRRRPEHLGGKRVALIAAHEPVWRFGVALAVEHDRWIVTQGGYFDDMPGSGDAAYLEFARTLAAPDIAELLAAAEPLTAPVGFGFPASRRSRYEHLARFPEGYLVFGDALCSFNPIYGQGMTAAALEAAALADCLTQGTRSLAPRFFAKASDIVDTPWQIAAGNDLRHPPVAPTVGHRALHELVHRQGAPRRSHRPRCRLRIPTRCQPHGAANPALCRRDGAQGRAPQPTLPTTRSRGRSACSP